MEAFNINDEFNNVVEHFGDSPNGNNKGSTTEAKTTVSTEAKTTVSTEATTASTTESPNTENKDEMMTEKLDQHDNRTFYENTRNIIKARAI